MASGQPLAPDADTQLNFEEKMKRFQDKHKEKLAVLAKANMVKLERKHQPQRKPLAPGAAAPSASSQPTDVVDIDNQSVTDTIKSVSDQEPDRVREKRRKRRRKTAAIGADGKPLVPNARRQPEIDASDVIFGRFGAKKDADEQDVLLLSAVMAGNFQKLTNHMTLWIEKLTAEVGETYLPTFAKATRLGLRSDALKKAISRASSLARYLNVSAQIRKTPA